MKKATFDWETEEDARTLARHAEIHADPKRHAKAVKAADHMAKEKATEAVNLHHAANMKRMGGKPVMVEDKVSKKPFKG